MYVKITAIFRRWKFCELPKLLLIMKIFILLLFASVLEVSALSTSAQQLSLSLHKVPLELALKKLRKQSQYNMFYNKEMLQNSKLVTVEFKNVGIGEAMSGILEGQALTYQIVDNNIIISRLSPQSRTVNIFMLQSISGKVTDEQGIGLPGVNIRVKNGKQTAVTNPDGTYKIDVPEEAILIFSSVGRVSREILVSNQKVINLVLADLNQGLNEVVVVGYGTTKKGDLTGAVSSISERSLQSRPVTNFQDALQGRASGVDIRETGGNLAGRYDINIRGVGSVTGSNSPLIVVDGVPLFSGALSTINPKDIVSVDILKDASSTAIYGARASNGVVIVTTRRGKSGQNSMSVIVDQGIEQIAKKYETLTTEQQRQLFVAAFANSNRNPVPYMDANNPVWQINTDWQDLATRTANRQNYSFNLSGGSDKNQYAMSASYMDRAGIVKQTDLKAYYFRLNNDVKLGNRLKISSNLSGSQQLQHVIDADGWGGGIFGNLASQHTYTQAYDENGNLSGISTAADPYFGANGNPLIDLFLPKKSAKTTRLLGSVKADLQVLKSLTLSANLGADLTLDKNDTYLPVYKIGLASRAIGAATIGNSQETNWVGDVTALYDKSWRKHDFKFLAGFSIQSFKQEINTATGSGTVDNNLDQLSNQTTFSASGSSISSGLVSTFGRLNYGYDSRYLLTVTIRRDGSSKFGQSNRYGTFPSASVAWRVSKEAFFNSGFINDFKVRTSYGLTGNQNIGDFAYVTRTTADPYVFGNTVVTGNTPVNIGNPFLKWESAKQFDVGIDLALLNNRINFTADYYAKRSEGLLVRTPVPFTASVSESPIKNIGSVNNTGVEIAVSTQNLTGAFKWSTDLNLSFNKNKVIDIGTNSAGSALQIPGLLMTLPNENANLTLAGREVGAFYMYEYAGVWQLGEEAQAAKWGSAVPGDPRFTDSNNNGLFDEGDKIFAGSPTPKYFGGITNNFTYKNFSFSFLVKFSGGNKIYNAFRNLNSRGVPFNQQLSDVLDWWTPTNPTHANPRPSQQGGNTTFLVTKVSTRYLEDGSFVKLKNISLSYDINQPFLKKAGIENAKLSVAANNIATFSRYKGLDPESSSSTSLLSGGLDLTPYPPARLYSVSLQLTF